jgi:hypothetical protein
MSIMKKLWMIGLLAFPLLLAQQANAQTEAKKQTATKKQVTKAKKKVTVKADLKKEEKMQEKPAAKQTNKGTKSKTPNSKIAIKEEGANVKKEKGVEDVE